MEFWDEEDEYLDNPQHFQVNVIILEARHLSMINSDCKVVVAIGNQTKTLRSKTARTDAPYFNEFCLFNSYQPLSALLDEILEVKLYGVQKLLKNRLIGGFAVEMSTVWVQPNHQFYHKWAALTDEKNPAAGVKGYLKCDIGILAQGTRWKQTEMDQAEKIEGHLLVPYGEVNDRQRAKFIFSVFRADNFSDYVATQPLRSLYAYVKITYAGKSGRTSVASNTFEPLWNEELAFDDMVPAMCQYVHIELCDAFKATANGTLGTTNLDLRNLSHESEKGFLPTYGPSFLYLYRNFGKLDHENQCPHNSCSFTYMCRLLMALRTEVVDYVEDVLVKKTNLMIKPKSIPFLQEGKYFNYNEFIFFAAVFDVLLFDTTIVNSNVSVRVNIGPDKPVSDEHLLRSTTDDVKPAFSQQTDGRDTEGSESIITKKTVTFEGDDVSETGSEMPILDNVEDEISSSREVSRTQAFLKQLMYWPSEWPENRKWGRELNQRLQRRERTNFRKWRQQRIQLKNWATDWKRKRKQDYVSEYDIQPKKVKLKDPAAETLKVRKPEEYSTGGDYFDTFQGSDNNKGAKMVNYDSSSASSSTRSVDLKKNEAEADLLPDAEYRDGMTLGKRGSKPDRVVQKPGGKYYTMKSLTTWAKDFKEQKKRRVTAIIERWKSSKRRRKLEQELHSDSDSGRPGYVNNRMKRLVVRLRNQKGLNRLKAWPTEWTWERKNNERQVGTCDREEWESDTSKDSTKTTARKDSIFKNHSKKFESPIAQYGKAREVSSQRKFETEVPQEKSFANVIAEVPLSAEVPPLVVPPAMTNTTENSMMTLTSIKEQSEIRDDELSDFALPYPRKERISDSDKSMWNTKTVWPTYVPAVEDEETSFSSPQEIDRQEKKESRHEKKHVSGRSSEASEKIARTNYSDFETRSEEDSAESPKRRKYIYEDLEDEEDEEEGEVEEQEEDEEMEDSSEPHEEKTEKLKQKHVAQRHEKDMEDAENAKNAQEKETGSVSTALMKTEEGVGKEKESEKSVESEKTKKRHWYKDTDAENTFSPDNTTEANVQAYKSLTGKNEESETDLEEVGVRDDKKKGKQKYRGTSHVAGDSQQLGRNYKRKNWAAEENGEEVEEEKGLAMSRDHVTWDDETIIDRGREESRHVRLYTGCNSTHPQPIKIRQRYGYTTFSGRYPCLHINGEWPNALRRMYRSNVVQRSVVRLAMGINEVTNESSNENKLGASDKLKRVYSEVSSECREILTLTAHIESNDTNLYRHRKKYYHREIKEMIEKMNEASKKKVLIAEDELNRATGYLSTLRRFAEDPEDSFPDTEIWLIKDGKRVAQHRMRTRKIVFSPKVSERGPRSGKIQSVIVRGKDGEVVAKLEMFMWFGLGSQFIECRNMLPPGFAHDVHQCPGTAVPGVPLLLTYAEGHYFKLRVHLFQARITAGADMSGLADPFVRVTIFDQQKESEVVKETLNPAWDETLVFPKLTIYGRADYIKVNSATVTIEIIDYDYLSKNELIGRVLLKPMVRLSSEEYTPPKLTWEGMQRGCSETGKILLAVELLEVAKDEPTDAKPDRKVVRIPKEIRPRSVGYRLEVLFWGVRELRKKGTRSTRVFVTLECAGKLLNSPLLKNALKYPNFPGTVQTLQLNLPEEHDFLPPLILKLYQTTSFSLTHETYAGNCMVPSVKVFFCEAVDDEERKEREIAFLELLKETNRVKHTKEMEAEEEEQAKGRKYMWRRLKTKMMDIVETVLAAFVRCFKIIKCKLGKSCSTVNVDDLPVLQEDESLDWWVKYYASKESNRNASDVEKLVVYDEELEIQPEYHGFSDFIYTFNMVIGKVRNEVESSVLMGKVKAAVKLYRWPLENNNSHTLYGVDIKKGLLQQLPSNEEIKYVARIYVISCKNLTPKDLYGKSDPYLYLQVGNQKINDSKNYIPKQVNPIFGKCFEFRGIFPQEHLLTVKVMDHDVLAEDDLIGETSIDLESRYYTKHHARCGISQVYATTGYTAWRDVSKPTEILKTVCKQSNMPEPVYSEKSVRIGDYEFQAETNRERHRMELQALAALKKWHEIPLRGFKIVPEHIETRPLYHPSFPGVEQGKIEMWVDIFPADFRYVPPIVDIKPRDAVAMELRAIVWNVEDVILNDTTLLFNEKMSDIYVQGWLNALEEDKQKTDVHYRSMNGEGNFNWRFIFPFKYIASERRLVVHKKMTAFDIQPEELKFPCRLELQVWDNDFLSDDFLGSLNLELSAMPRGAKISTRCKLSMFEESTPKIDLFKIRRTRGWWPFRRIVDAESSEYRLTGKIDLELEVVTEKEATDYPVGKGREEPRALPGPKRPESSFIWALNPLKTFRYIICRKYGKHLVLLLLVAMLIAFILIGIYAFPGYTVKRMIGA